MKKANNYTFAVDSINVNGVRFPASYSIAKNGDVFIFTSLKINAEAEPAPVRIHVTTGLPYHANAVKAAEEAINAEKAVKGENISKSNSEPKEVASVSEVKESAPVEKTAPAKKASRKAVKKDELKTVEVQPDPAPGHEEPAHAKAEPVSKPWIGSTITGKGFAIAFDQAAGRTRVTVEGTPTDAQRSAIEQAGFYWSPRMCSWNKGLTCKAYRAAQLLANTLNALA